MSWPVVDFTDPAHQGTGHTYIGGYLQCFGFTPLWNINPGQTLEAQIMRFTRPFTQPPLVTCTLYSNGWVFARLHAFDTESIQFKVQNVGRYSSVFRVVWYAVGPA